MRRARCRAGRPSATAAPARFVVSGANGTHAAFMMRGRLLASGPDGSATKAHGAHGAGTRTIMKMRAFWRSGLRWP
eukprot:1515556-Rhodomonas_salina.2